MDRRGFIKSLGISSMALMMPIGLKRKEKSDICVLDNELVVDVIMANGTVIYTNKKSKRPLKIREGNTITVSIDKVGSNYQGELIIS
jgi:hypothetical protein